MTSLKTEPRVLPYYPLLLGLFPFLALVLSNLDQARPALMLRSGLIALLMAVALFGLLRLVVRDGSRAALLAAWILLLFYTYGHVYGLVEGKMLLGVAIGRHRLLAPLWGLLLAGGVFGLLRVRAVAPSLTRLFNSFSLILVLLPLLQIGVHAFQTGQTRKAAQAQASLSVSANLQANAQVRPDIYYIILDGYTREDALREAFGYDNHAFVQQLQQLGFVLPNCTQSNYAWTALSLSSALQMNYIETFNPNVQNVDEHMAYATYHGYIAANPVRSSLEALGYKTVSFETGYPFTEVSDTNYFVIMQDNPLARLQNGPQINNFELLFLRTTAFRVLGEAQDAFLKRAVKDLRTPDQVHFDRVNFVLDQLDQTAGLLPTPKFVFAHIVAPHAPFVFAADGSYTDLRSPEVAYPNEITYINQRVLQVVRSILQQSKTPPIIIIQGDHGWDMDHRMQILNAYYLPNDGSRALYDTITPVNTFRVLFNTYFGANYDLLPDKSFFSSQERQFDFHLTPSSCVSQP